MISFRLLHLASLFVAARRVAASTLAAATPSGVGQLLCVRSARKGQGRVVLHGSSAPGPVQRADGAGARVGEEK